MLLCCVKETKNRENRKQAFFRKLRELVNRKRFWYVRLEEGLFFDCKNGHYKQMSRQIFQYFCSLMRIYMGNKKMFGRKNVNDGLKRSPKSYRSAVFAHNTPLVASKKALKTFFPRYITCFPQHSNFWNGHIQIFIIFRCYLPVKKTTRCRCG